MVDVFPTMCEAKKFIKTLLHGTGYKVLNVMDEQIFVFYRKKEERK